MEPSASVGGPTPESPLLIGILVDVSGSMTIAIENKSGKSKSRLEGFRDALEAFVKRARDLSKDEIGAQIAPRVHVFAYGFGFNNPLSFFLGRPGATVRDLLALPGLGSTTVGADLLAEQWPRFQEHVERLAKDMFGGTPMAEGLDTVLERFRQERASRSYYGTPILFILSDGEPDEVAPIPELAERLKRDGIVIVSCFVTSADIAKSRVLYARPEPSWPPPARLMFDCSSILEDNSSYMVYARERHWEAPNGARLFAQINQSEALEEFLQFALSPVEAGEEPPPKARPENEVRGHPRVFISYAHQSAQHVRRVLELSNRLRADGVDCMIDQYLNGSPPEGWALWMERQIERVDFVLLVASEAYKRRYDGTETPTVGRGVTWEAVLTRVDLYEAQGVNEKFIPVLFDADSPLLLPKPVRAHNQYRLNGDYEKLLRRLTAQPLIAVPPVGVKRRLPPDPI
jgi:hypothetical protein